LLEGDGARAKATGLLKDDDNVVVFAEAPGVHARAVDFLPGDLRHEVLRPEYFFKDHTCIMRFVVIDNNPQTAVFAQQFAHKRQARIHHA
jgi:hypothetical protein